jgi:hypothetical protein
MARPKVNAWPPGDDLTEGDGPAEGERLAAG